MVAKVPRRGRATPSWRRMTPRTRRSAIAVRGIVAQARPRTPWQPGCPRERCRPSRAVPVT